MRGNFRKKKTVIPRLSPLGEGRFAVFACGLLVTLIAVFLLLYPPELLRFFDFRMFDMLLSAQKQQSVKNPPVVVGIDEESLLAFGQWPWPRYRLARLVEELKDQGVAAIGIDLLMVEKDRTSLDVILRERQRDLNEDFGGFAETVSRVQNDQLLAKALSEAPTVLGFKFLDEAIESGATSVVPTPLAGVVIRNERGNELPWSEPKAVLSSLDLLAQAAAREAFVNAVTDRDGIVRRVPLLQNFQGNYYPSLALATVLQATGTGQLRFDLLSQEASLSFNGSQVSLDRRGNLLLGFANTAAYRYVSAADLLQGKLADHSLAGSVVFVGAVAAGLGDRHVTPLDRNFPGVKIHAVVASNLLNGGWYSHPVWARGAEFVSVLALGVLSAWLLSSFSLKVPLLMSLLAAVGAFWNSLALFQVGHYFVSPTLPVLVLVLNAGLLGLLRYGIAAKHLRERSKSLLKAQDATIVSLITLAETRDSDTGAHVLRTQRFVRTLAEQLRRDSRYSSEITDEDVEMLFQSAPLHDIGKVGIPDKILLKNGRLTDEEVAVMKEHPQLGAMALSCAVEVLGQPEDSAYLHYARQMAATHHERWDGSGYPEGLRGEEIPLAGRLMALADVYDAMVSVRSYKKAMSHEQARDYILSMSGQLFDPEIADAFLACEANFAEIGAEYRDAGDEILS